MPTWVGPTVAISLLVIALCVLGMVLGAIIALREGIERGESLAREVGELRRELAPALQALGRLGKEGAEIADLAKEEVREMVYSARRLRKDVEKGITRTRRRLADFEAVVDVVQDEFEETALDVTSALHTVRTGGG
ncbi:MAG TPA: hypothetical protein PLJ23_11640, partial [Gemmatimonadales bacterium]|nr:hypothetical protein [Gemmatimonadales bacterium]